MGELTELTESTFDDHLAQADEPVIVDFWAEWCGPCRIVAPALEEISKEEAGKVVVAKVNVDHAPELARRYDVQSIPTMILFEKGEMKHRVVGGMAKAQLLAEFRPYFKN